jgi:hypothetical protein
MHWSIVPNISSNWCDRFQRKPEVPEVLPASRSIVAVYASHRCCCDPSWQCWICASAWLAMPTFCNACDCITRCLHVHRHRRLRMQHRSEASRQRQASLPSDVWSTHRCYVKTRMPVIRASMASRSTHMQWTTSKESRLVRYNRHRCIVLGRETD